MLTPKKTTWFLVCDGARGHVVVNRGRGTGLEEIRHAEHGDATARTRELGTDRPGRSIESVGGSRHAMEPRADWHEFEKTRFAREMAGVVNRAALDRRFDRLVIAAPPKVLGELRRHLHPEARGRLAGEIDKDLTNVAVHDLPSHLEGFANL